MKMITAVIKPFKLDDIRKAISEVGVQGVTVTEVRGFGRQRGHTEIYRGAEYTVEFVPKTKIEIAVVDELAEHVIEALMLLEPARWAMARSLYTSSRKSCASAQARKTPARFEKRSGELH